MWLKPEKTQPVNANGVSGEQGSFKFFDVATSTVQEKDDMFLDYRMCEDRPSGRSAQAAGGADEAGGSPARNAMR